MFVDAVEKMGRCTRPVLFILRKYKSDRVIPGLATLFFVNDEGVAITCRHVAQELINSEKVNQTYAKFRAEALQAKRENPAGFKKALRMLETRYNYTQDSYVNVKCRFLDCPSGIHRITYHLHPKYDLAVIRFLEYDHLCYSSPAPLIMDSSRIKAGRTLCRLGFPFPEFNNFRYNAELDDIEWTGGEWHTPYFPIDGIITRLVANESGIYAIEMSTPGLRGQSGGPLFDPQGRVYGMQSMTKHLHLGFDMDHTPININGEQKFFTNQPFLHVGECIHIDIIKAFLRELDIPFSEDRVGGSD